MQYVIKGGSQNQQMSKSGQCVKEVQQQGQVFQENVKGKIGPTDQNKLWGIEPNNSQWDWFALGCVYS